MVKILGIVWQGVKKTFKIGLYSCLASLVVILVVAGFNVHYVYFDKNNLPNIESFVRFELPATGEIYDTEGKVIIELAKEYRHIQSYGDLPPIVQDAIFAAEDKRFYEHNGVDFKAIYRAVLKNFFHLAAIWNRKYDSHSKIQQDDFSFSQGASTITQQLVRLYFLPQITSLEKNNHLISDNWKTRLLTRLAGIHNTNSLLRKREEMRISIWLEKEMIKRYGSKRKAKEEILARFANFVYLGGGRYGFDAAAKLYFDKNIKDFDYDDADKAAFLAGLIKRPAPSRLTNIKKYLDRRNEILDLMSKSDYFIPDKKEELKNKPLELKERNPIKTASPAAVAKILSEIKKVGFTVDDFFEGRFQIYSTNNLKIQIIANKALENGLKKYEERYPESKGIIQGSVIVLRNSDGAILAEVGGRQVYVTKPNAYTDYNRAENSHRQPGSSFKPFVYLTAFSNGLTLNSIVIDSPVSVPMGSIKVGNKWVRRPPKWIANYDGKFKGPIPARKALAESRNAAAIRLTRSLADGKMMGIEKVVNTAHLLGIKSPLHNPNERPYITTAIGATEVTLVELANAYRAMASGVYAEPYLVVKLTDRNGGIIYSQRNTIKPLDIDQAALEQIQEGMRGVVRIPGGTAHSLDSKDFAIPVMGKTGTTNDFRDARFGGSTFGVSGITVAVWIGYDDFRELGPKETGGRTALPIFKEIMLNIYKNNLAGPIPEFPEEIEKNIDKYLQSPR